MTLRSLYTAATGMTAMETKLDVIANNLANIETTGFKRGQTNFEDLLYVHEMLPGSLDSAGNLTATGISVGLGTKLSSIQTNYGQGTLKDSSSPLHVAIQGRGFFSVQDPSTGQNLYTRDGSFSKNANGQLVMGSAGIGRLLEPSIQIPEDATDILISSEGEVSVRQPGTTAFTSVGTIELTIFPNAEGLLKMGENLLAETEASGPPTSGTPGQTGIGVLRQGYLEASNVEPVQELIDLITTQRAFELNSQAVKVGDEVMQLVANLKRM